MAPDIANELKWLCRHALNAQHEYEEAVDNGAAPRLGPLFREMIKIHAQIARELALDLQKNGELAEAARLGTNAVHSPLFDARAFLHGADENVLEGLIDGEQRNVACYNKAFNRGDMPLTLKEHLMHQQYCLDAAIFDMQVMKQ
jgi:hypothetical protein